jgi:type VI secretion system secreted protein VgrG
MAISQEHRIGKLTTPFGEDVLALARFDGTEGLSELFEYRLEALSEEMNIDFNRAIGDHCYVTFDNYKVQRVFDGILVEAQWIGVRETFAAYRLVLRPWIWMMSRRARSKIWENKNVTDIIQEVFKEYSSDIKESYTQNYPKLEYCVQYRETDLAFVSRLMELNGIYYFFEHAKGKHTLHLVDSKSGHENIPGEGKISFIPDLEQTHRDVEHFTHWNMERRFRSGKVELRAYDYLKPKTDLTVNKNGTEKYKKSDLELYDYPHKYFDHDEGEKFAKVRLEAEQALDHRRHAAGAAGSLCPGWKFQLDRHPVDNKDFLVVRCSHTFVTEHFRSGASAISDQAYYGNYELIDAATQFRAPLVTPRAIVDGPQTGVVVTKQGDEEIDVDKDGRILVKFFWERDGNFSRRVRVMQPWAYKQWGTQFIPRVGMEVVVVYEEGDPDRPLVIGSVYNEDNKFPYTLPDDKTQSGVKSNSSKGGNGYNEFMFEDKKGGEIIRMHAEKDHEVTILHKETTEIGERFTPMKGSPSREHTLKNGDDKLTIDKGDQNVTISMGDQNVTISMGDQKITISLGSQETFAMQKVSTTSMVQNTTTVAPSSVTLSPASIALTSPTISQTAMATINVTAPVINITGVVNLTGVLNITGGITVNTMVPVLIPA